MKQQSTRKPFGLLLRAFLWSVLVVSVSSCRQELKKTTAEEFRMEVSGEAQGTTWTMVYYDLQGRNFKPQVDSILKEIDRSVSTYLKGSVIDRWNHSDSGTFVDPLFVELLKISWSVYNSTSGAFDPTVMPLVKYWGFGPEKYEQPDLVEAEAIDSLRGLLCFDRLRLRRNQRSFKLESLIHDTLSTDSFFLSKPFPQAQLDFNAVGQGWSVDKVVEFLDAKGIKVYFLELGGEIRAGQPKPDGSLWRFGVDKPIEDLEERELQAIVALRNKGLATSGNYRKFYMKEGVRYAHTIDPATGYPVKHNLLSATVVSDEAAIADAYATAFLVMGQDSTLSFIEEKSYLNNYVYLISSENGVFTTEVSPEIEALIEEN